MCKWLLDASITNILGNIVKKNKCRKYINSFVLGIASISFLGLMVHVTCDSKEHEFAQIMKDENILIEGENGNLTLKQLEGLLDEINIENAYIKKNMRKKFIIVINLLRWSQKTSWNYIIMECLKRHKIFSLKELLIK